MILIGFETPKKLVEAIAGQNSLVSSESEPLQFDGYNFPTAAGKDWRAIMDGLDLHFFAPYSVMIKSKSNVWLMLHYAQCV